MHDTANAIACGLLADVGRGPALGYLVGRLLSARSWCAFRQVLRLIVAVVARGGPVLPVQGGVSS